MSHQIFLSAKGKGNIWTKERKFSIFWIEARNLIILVTPYIKRTKHKTNNNFLFASRKRGSKYEGGVALPPPPFFLNQTMDVRFL